MGKYFLIITTLIFNTALILSASEVFANKQVQVDIQLWIINWYSWTLSFIDTYYFDWTQYYTSQTTVGLSLGASETSTYILDSNDTSIQSWNGSWEYTTMVWAPLLWPDGVFEFQASFTNADNERVQSNTLLIQKDTTSPSVVDQLSVLIAKAWWNTWIVVSRDPSSDSGAWIWWYRVVFASDSSLISTVEFTTSTWPLIVDTSLIPPWYTTVQIIAFDNVWNVSHSVPVEYSPYILLDQSWNISSIGSVWWTIQILEENTPKDTLTSEEWIEDNKPPVPVNEDSPSESPILIFKETTPNLFAPSNIAEQPNLLVVTVPPFSQKSIFWSDNVPPQGNLDISNTIPVSWVRWVGSQPYSKILMCSDWQCVEISESWQVCWELSCFDLEPEFLHTVATSQQGAYYETFIAYHKELSRRLTYALVLLYYSLCYDIELHLRWSTSFNEKK